MNVDYAYRYGPSIILNPKGHVDPGKQNFIADAFSDGSRTGTTWWYWHTALNPIKFNKP